MIVRAMGEAGRNSACQADDVLVEAHAFAFCLSRESAIKRFRLTQQELPAVVVGMFWLRDFIAVLGLGLDPETLRVLEIL